MFSKRDIIDSLPPFRNEKVVIKGNQSTKDIINEILKTHNEFAADYDRIYQYFDEGSAYKTTKKIWEFLKWNLNYNAEPGEEQSVKSPSAIFSDRNGVDCKHYSLAAGGLIDSILRNTGQHFDWCYRFATDNNDGHISHVFVVVFDEKGKEIWIDPVLSGFNQNKNWIKEIDKKPMLVKISGVNDQSKTVEVDPEKAWISFLGFITFNLFNVADLMLINKQITLTALKAYCDQKKYDYSQLINFLNHVYEK